MPVWDVDSTGPVGSRPQPSRLRDDLRTEVFRLEALSRR